MKINSLFAVGVGVIFILILVGLSHSFAVNHPESDHQLVLYNKVLRCGIKAYQMKDYSRATQLFRKAISTRPNSDKAWFYFKKSVLYELAEQDMLKPEMIESIKQDQKSFPAIAPSKSSPGELTNDDGGC